MGEQGVLDDDLRHHVGRVREFERKADVTRGVDPRVCGLQVVIHLHAGAVVLDAGLLQAQAVDVRRPAYAYQDLVGLDLVLGAARGVADQLCAVCPPFDAADGCVERQPHPVRMHAGLHDGGGVGVLARQDARRLLDERYPAAEAGERLRHLAADRTGANHREPLRQFGQREDRLVGAVAGIRQTGDGERGGARAGADGGPGEAQHGAVHLDGVGSGEAAVTDEDVHAESGEPLGRVDAAEARPQLPHAGHDGAEIALHGAGKRQAEFVAACNLGPGARRPHEPLRRDAADVEAIASHQVALDQRHAGAEPGGPRRRDEPGRTGADDDDVVAPGRLGIAPRGRMNVGDERLVVRVVGQQAQRCILCLCRHRVPSVGRNRPAPAGQRAVCPGPSGRCISRGSSGYRSATYSS